MIPLKNHPFAVEAFFESSLVLTYAVPRDELKHLIPPCLELDGHNDQWAFIAVALVQTKHLRPAGFPTWVGNNFFLIGYRIFVRYTTSEGKRLRGLYILKSETDKNKMRVLGNIFTHYNYGKTDIALTVVDDHRIISSQQSQLNIDLSGGDETTKLPIDSVFADWKEARRFAGPLPFTFTFNAKTNEVLIIEGVRENWTPKPVSVHKHEVGFIRDLQLKSVQLANAFIVENIPYKWKKGRIDLWQKG